MLPVCPRRGSYVEPLCTLSHDVPVDRVDRVDRVVCRVSSSHQINALSAQVAREFAAIADSRAADSRDVEESRVVGSLLRQLAESDVQLLRLQALVARRRVLPMSPVVFPSPELSAVGSGGGDGGADARDDVSVDGDAHGGGSVDVHSEVGGGGVGGVGSGGVAGGRGSAMSTPQTFSVRGESPAPLFV
jgi:hypothetical protein